MDPSYSKFCAWFGGLFAMFALFTLVNWLFLWNTDDYYGAEKQAEKHLETDGLLGSIVHSVREVKIPTYRVARPDVVVVGTSRATVLRAYFFNRPFYNLAGGALNGVVRQKFDLQDIERTYFSVHRPSLLIVILDPWAYNDRQERMLPGFSVAQLLQPSGAVRVHPVYLPTYHALKGRIPISDLFRHAISFSDGEKSDVVRFGFSAIRRNVGLLSDGSTFSFEIDPLEERFAKSLDNFRNAFGPVQRYAVNPALIDGLAETADNFHTKGIKVVFILAPLSTELLGKIACRPALTTYLSKVRHAFARSLPHYFDMLEPTRFSSGDCEFTDGTHGGEVTYLRMFLAIDRLDPTVFDGKFAAARAAGVIAENVGQTVTTESRVGRAYVKAFGKPSVPGCPGQ